MKSIVVPLDGSALADRSVPFAATIAARAGWSVVLLRAVNTLSVSTETAGVHLTHEAQAALDATASALEAQGIAVTTRVVDKSAEWAILDAASDPGVGLIVMSTHGRGGLGRFIYGSVTDAVMRQARVPVLTVPAHGLPAWPTDRPLRILVPLDGSALSESAIDPACELADVLGASLYLGSVVTFPTYAAYAEGYLVVTPDACENAVSESRQYLEDVARELRTETRPVTACATYGTPYFGITSMAREIGAGLIVMATHGRGGMSRTLLGSVAMATIRQTAVPIVLVRPDAVASASASPTPPAASANQSPAAPAAEGPKPPIEVTLSPDELTLLTRVVGEWFHTQPADPAWAEPIRLLLDKLRSARAPLVQAPAGGRSPHRQ